MKRRRFAKTLTGRAHVVGLGLIGSSVALALGSSGWEVSGWDTDEAVRVAARKHDIALDQEYAHCDLVFVCVPAGHVVKVANEVAQGLVSPHAVISDVAGVKTGIVRDVLDGRFIGGHPMAGSELRGPAGASSELFNGCNWILTPSSHTTPDTYSKMHAIIRDLNANVVAIEPEQHDRLMSVASHVPHLVAGALMNEATATSRHDAILLQLAAGGFRDMTRIAAGDPAIWPDVLIENQQAVKDSLSSVINRLTGFLEAIESNDREGLEQMLHSAAMARRELPGRATQSENLTYLRVELSDEPGQLARVTVTASDMLVNIYDIEISHSASEAFGTLLLAVDTEDAKRLSSALSAIGFKVGVS